MQAPAPTRSETQPPKRRWHPEHEDDSLDDPYKRPRLHVHVPPPPPTRHHTALPGGTVQQHHAAARDDSRSRKDFEAARILMDMPATDVSREPAIAEEEEEHPRSV